MSKSKSLHQRPAEPCTQLMPLGHDLYPHDIRPSLLHERSARALLDEILLEEFEDLRETDAFPSVHPTKFLHDLQRKYHEKIMLLATRAQFGFHNRTDYKGRGIVAAFPKNIVGTLRTIIGNGNDELFHSIAWTSKQHATTLTYDAGSFEEIEEKKQQVIRFCISTTRAETFFSVPSHFVQTIALLKEDCIGTKTIWANPLFKPNGSPRPREQIRAIAKICDIETTQLKDLLSTKKRYSDLCTSFGRGFPRCQIEVFSSII